ncbi:polysaccharide deacetylase [Desulfuromonas soudanensis]|uniref:Polysaccharide deacetylase n=1 Tax=Desulfuromonas soudanensis TaxID=1603606 RepID=A0A0M4D4H1_9BACT|nr:polysaccharide deacetylase family protein [Desulfuromonas soudanensis]ALC15485.1 polysaccharide deacetylase [Desulfuromonas soudanensis]
MGDGIYRTVLPAYRFLQRLKNAATGLIDPPVVVLLFHRVTVLSSDPERLAVSPDNFRRQMGFLKERFRLVRLEEDWSALSEPAVAVTFDDGYADNVLEALPILEDVGVPATFFISTGHMGTDKEFWWDRMERILLRGVNLPAAFTLVDCRYGQSWPTETAAERQTLYHALNALAQKVEIGRIDGWLEQLAAWSGQQEGGAGVNRTLTREELRVLGRSPWATVGAHTVSHAALSALSTERQREEIFVSKETLEKELDKKIEVFSYPFGNRAHYNRDSIALCRQAGFLKAAANFPGQVHRWTDPYQLPRRVVRNWDLDTFAGHMKNWV